MVLQWKERGGVCVGKCVRRYPFMNFLLPRSNLHCLVVEGKGQSDALSCLSSPVKPSEREKRSKRDCSIKGRLERDRGRRELSLWQVRSNGCRLNCELGEREEEVLWFCECAISCLLPGQHFSPLRSCFCTLSTENGHLPNDVVRWLCGNNCFTGQTSKFCEKNKGKEAPFS